MLGLRCKCCDQLLSPSEIRVFDEMDGLCYKCTMLSFEEYNILDDRDYEHNDLSLFININGNNSNYY